MTRDQWIKLPRGTEVRVKRGTRYHLGKLRRTYRLGGGEVWVSVDGLPTPVSSEHVEVVPASGDPSGSNTGAQQSSPYPGWSGTPWQRLVEEMKR
jgi:hypothetical protein